MRLTPLNLGHMQNPIITIPNKTTKAWISTIPRFHPLRHTQLTRPPQWKNMRGKEPFASKLALKLALNPVESLSFAANVYLCNYQCFSIYIQQKNLSSYSRSFNSRTFIHPSTYVFYACTKKNKCWYPHKKGRLGAKKIGATGATQPGFLFVARWPMASSKKENLGSDRLPRSLRCLSKSK